MIATPTEGPAENGTEARPSGEASARRALRWEAAYCVVAGVATAAVASSIADQLEISAWVVATVGAAGVAWAGLVAWLARHPQWRRAAAVGTGLNALAAAAIGYWAVSRGGTSGIILGLLALQVGGFAVVQGTTLTG